jgi:hypothetical protein
MVSCENMWDDESCPWKICITPPGMIGCKETKCVGFFKVRCIHHMASTLAWINKVTYLFLIVYGSVSGEPLPGCSVEMVLAVHT